MDFFWSVLAGLAGGLLLTSLAPKPQAPEQPTLLAPPAATSPATMPKAPDYTQKFNANAAKEARGPSAGPSSTFLTGAAGVDPSSLNLARNTLLGA